MHDKDLPKLDLEKLRQKDEEELFKLKTCMIELGFFKMINHGFDPQLKEDFEKMSESFFDLPFASKNAVRRELNTKTFRGYYGPGVESTNDKPDIKEAFTWGPALLRGSITTWYHGPNLIPSELHLFKETFEAYCSKMSEISLVLLKGSF